MNLLLIIALWFGGQFFSVAQQDCPLCVSDKIGTFTEFAAPREYGNRGLLAHNYLTGQKLISVQIGDVVTLFYSDESQMNFEIVDILYYRRVAPSIYRGDKELIGESELFGKIYGAHPLVLQTCWGQDGRVFYIARTVPESVGVETR